jgi:hypothetical protein
MKIYAHVDTAKANVIDAHYVDDIHETIPDDCIEITEDQWKQSCENGGQCFIVGGIFVCDPYPKDSTIYIRKSGKWVKDTSHDAEIIQAQRRTAYTAESDPLFFKEQRGEVPAGTWAAKVSEIKEKYPKP